MTLGIGMLATYSLLHACFLESVGGSTPDTDMVLLRQDEDIRSNNYCQVLGENE